MNRANAKGFEENRKNWNNNHNQQEDLEFSTNAI